MKMTAARIAKGPKGWSVKTMKRGTTKKFEDGSSVKVTKTGKIVRKRSVK